MDSFYNFVCFVTFCLAYIYCIASYGFLFGLGLGWIPSLILAATWPVSLPIAAIVAIF